MTTKENSYIDNLGEQELKMSDLTPQYLGNRHEFDLRGESANDYMTLLKKYNDLYAEFQKLKAGKKLSEKENTKLPGDQKNEVYQHLYQLEHNQSFFSKLLNLKSQNAKLQKLVIGMKAIVEYYEKRTGAKLPEELLTDIDLRKIFEESNLEGGLKLLKSKWDAEKQEIINKYEEEIRNYQSKITGLLSQLRAEQKKNKDAFKGSKYPNEMDLSKQKIELLFSKDVVDELKEENNALKLKIREFEEKLMNSAKGLAASGGAGGKNSPEYLLLHQKMVENQEKYLQLEKKLKLFESMNSQNQNNSSQKNEEVQLLKQRVQELNEAEWQYGNRMKEYEDIIGSMKKEIVKNLQSKQSNKTRVKNFVKNAQKEIKEIRSTLASIEMMVSSQKAGFFTSLKTNIGQMLGDFIKMSNVYDIRVKYIREMKERRRLFNILQEMKGNIRVLCRVRPLMSSEKESAVMFPTEYNVSVKDAITDTIKTFEFDGIFQPTASQSEVFNEVKPLITSCLDGYNVCIFAYGQTGSGKTYTMEGPPNDRGVYHRAIEELFKNVNERKANSYDYKISISLVEIYNEQIRDLFCEPVQFPQQQKKLEIKQGPNGNYIPDLTVLSVNSPQEVHAVMESGIKNRAMGMTNLNEHSSRSHLIYTVYAVGYNAIEGSTFYGKLHLIDLAGSERLSKSKATGDTQKEAIYINKSLSAFGDVIAARLNKNSHVPYRNSMLTYLLQDSLAGESKTLMVVQVSPAVNSADETICSLKFANRVMNVEMGQAKKSIQKKGY